LKKIEHYNKKLWLQLECLNLRASTVFIYARSKTIGMLAIDWLPDFLLSGNVQMSFSGCAGLMSMTTSNLSGWKKKCNE
jgi:hypothetical protein